jgi:two-component system sensor histidine kinase KdpD
MEQAIRNIIDNAAIHTGQGTEITISAKKLENSIQIRIEDNGPGLPKQNPEKVFEKFYREKENIPGGTGLGLTITKSIVELHGGKITAYNRPTGTGAVFVITLPFSEHVSEQKNG